MVGEEMIRRSILLLSFIITIISAATIMQSIEGTNTSLSGANVVCGVAPATCFAGLCTGGICAPCPYDPLRCCLVTLGNCTSPDGAPYGLCASACGWGYGTNTTSIKP